MRSTAYVYIKENGKAFVSRTMPTIMNAHMSEEDWELFCGKIDEALIPANKFKRRNSILFPIIVINIIALLLNIAYNIFAVEEPLNLTRFRIDRWKDELDNADFILVTHSIVTLLLLFLYFVLVMKWRKSSRDIRTEIGRVCDQLGGEKPGMKILLQDHLFIKRGRLISYYIEVRVSTSKNDTKGSAEYDLHKAPSPV